MIRWHLKSQIAHIEEDYRQLNGPPAPKSSQMRRFGQFFAFLDPKIAVSSQIKPASESARSFYVLIGMYGFFSTT